MNSKTFTGFKGQASLIQIDPDTRIFVLARDPKTLATVLKAILPAVEHDPANTKPAILISSEAFPGA
jgi:hypothetical protein